MDTSINSALTSWSKSTKTRIETWTCGWSRPACPSLPDQSPPKQGLKPQSKYLPLYAERSLPDQSPPKQGLKLVVAPEYLLGSLASWSKSTKTRIETKWFLWLCRPLSDLPDQSPPKQGLKRFEGDLLFKGLSSLPDQSPPKQGLKLVGFSLRSTCWYTLPDQSPPKQGLKLPVLYGQHYSCFSSWSKSTKTRIETYSQATQ